MLAGHFAGLRAELERIFTNSTVGVCGDMECGNLDRRHRLNSGFGRWRVLAPAPGYAVDFNLCELVEEAIEPRSHKEIGHARRKRAEAGSDTVVVVELESRRGVAIGVGGAAEDDDGVEGGSIDGGGTAGAAEAQIGTGLVADHKHGVGGEGAAVGRCGRGRWEAVRRGIDGLEEAAVAVGAGDGVLIPDPDEAAATVAPVRCRRGSHPRE